MKKRKLPRKQELCIVCRRCCKSIGVSIDPENYVTNKKDLAEFYAARGFAIYETGPFLLLTHPDFPCPNLTENGCRIYNKRPRVCRDYSGIEDFGEKCLWSTLPEHRQEKKNTRIRTAKKK